MTTFNEMARVLAEYDTWKEERALDGPDLSVDGYLEHLEHEENARIVRVIRDILTDAQRDYTPAARLQSIVLAFSPDQKEVSA